MILTIPTGHILLNAAEGAVKRHGGSYEGEIEGEAAAFCMAGVNPAMPTDQLANAS